MKLIGTHASPFTRKVRVVLAEKRIDCEFVIDRPVNPDSRVPLFNPLGKVPVLVLDDETTIFDSRVIVEYLDHASPVTRLVPEDTRPRMQVRRWEALADGCTDATIAVNVEKQRAAERQSKAWIDRQQGKIERSLEAMANDLAGKTWCCGDFFNFADVAVGCCLGYLDLRQPDLNWRKTYPNLAKLADKLAQRPSFRDTAPPPPA